jgi:hypothetical protein
MYFLLQQREITPQLDARMRPKVKGGRLVRTIPRQVRTSVEASKRRGLMFSKQNANSKAGAAFCNSHKDIIKAGSNKRPSSDEGAYKGPQLGYCASSCHGSLKIISLHTILVMIPAITACDGVPTAGAQAARQSSSTVSLHIHSAPSRTSPHNAPGKYRSWPTHTIKNSSRRLFGSAIVEQLIHPSYFFPPSPNDASHNSPEACRQSAPPIAPLIAPNSRRSVPPSAPPSAPLIWVIPQGGTCFCAYTCVAPLIRADVCRKLRRDGQSERPPANLPPWGAWMERGSGPEGLKGGSPSQIVRVGETWRIWEVEEGKRMGKESVLGRGLCADPPSSLGKAKQPLP